VRLRFVGFWAMTPAGLYDTYPQQATEVIEQLPRDDTPTVLAGDFNASWRNAHHLENVRSLAARGMVNAYNSFKGIRDEAEPEHATSYFRWSSAKPYHMDFVFVPKVWSIKDVAIGSFADYPARRLSDHVPVVVTLDANA
jgi:endonuclease/exonuclease/phosphatase family metal-dependent hydrolase